MLLGQFTYILDDKGRLTIPSRFREALSAKIVITRGLDRCLTIYPMEIWRELAQKVTALPITNPRGRELRRELFSDAADLVLDGQGRALIPDRLREFAGLELSSAVLIVGLETFVELWDPQAWADKNSHRQEALAEDPALWADLNI